MRWVSIIFPPFHKNINPPLASSLTEIHAHLLRSLLTFSLTAKVHNICISSLRFHEQVSVTTSSQAHNAILATQFPNQEIFFSPQLLHYLLRFKYSFCLGLHTILQSCPSETSPQPHRCWCSPRV